MNKQEAIEKIEKLEGLTILDKAINFDSEMIPKNKTLSIVNQIDEPVKPPEPEPWKPEKPIVPQFVADWYEENKDCLERNLYNLCVDFHKRELQDDLYEWFTNCKNKPIQTIVKMKLYGYEVEKEKLYTARLKVSGEYLNSKKANKRYMMGSTNKNLVKELKSYCYTQAELKELNIWDNPAFEVEEVEE